MPLQLPVLNAADLDALTGRSFGQCLADVLNLFFSARLDGWDVDFCIGRYPVRLVPLNQKVYVAEAWHNPDRDFLRMVRNLSSRIRGDKENIQPTDWAWMSTRIAVLFAVYGQMCRQGLLRCGQSLDISFDAGDFSGPMAAWYAKTMGLPIGCIVCTNQDSSIFWDFLRSGSLQPGIGSGNSPSGIHTGLERLIFSNFGNDEVNRYLLCCNKGSTYSLSEFRLNQMCSCFRASVVSGRRVASAIRSTYATAAYLLDPSTALAFSGLQDVRTAEGEARVTLLLSERCCAHYADSVAAAAGISADELRMRF